MIFPTTIAYDTEQSRPACVVVAAALGADTAVPAAFDTVDWLTVPTDAMRVYPVTDQRQLDRLVRVTRSRRTT